MENISGSSAGATAATGDATGAADDEGSASVAVEDWDDRVRSASAPPTGKIGLQGTGAAGGTSVHRNKQRRRPPPLVTIAEDLSGKRDSMRTELRRATEYGMQLLTLLNEATEFNAELEEKLLETRAALNIDT